MKTITQCNNCRSLDVNSSINKKGNIFYKCNVCSNFEQKSFSEIGVD